MISARALKSSFDPGWLFLAAGMAICVSTLLLPARGDLSLAEGQLAQMRDQHRLAAARLAAYDEFLTELETGSPSFVERLAASELNLLPKGAAPVLHDMSASSSSTLEWIESSVPRHELTNEYDGIVSQSMLGDISQGVHRNLFLGLGICCIFFGLLSSLPGERRSRIDTSNLEQRVC